MRRGFIKILILISFISLNGYGQDFVRSYKEKYGQTEFKLTKEQLLELTTDSLKNLLKEIPIDLYTKNFLRDYSGQPLDEDNFKYAVLLAYLSGAILQDRGQLSPTDLFYLAWAKENNSEYIDAIIDYTNALKGEFDKGAFPSRLDIYRGRAKSKFEVGDYFGAISDYNNALKLDPNSSNCYTERARCFALTKRFTEAISDLTKAIQIKPDEFRPYYYRALAYLSTDKKELACLDFSKAGELGYKKAYDEIRENCH